MRLLAALLLASLLTGCVTTTVPDSETNRITSVTKPGVPLRQGARVTWLEGSGTLRDTDEARALRPGLESAMIRELQARGFAFSPRTQPRPDYYFGYLAAQTDLLDRGDVLMRFGFHQGFDDWTSSKPTGTLLVLIVDANTQQIIWRASVEAILHRDLPTSERMERIEHFVTRLFDSMPPTRA